MILKIGYSFLLGSLLIIAFEPFNFWALAFIVPFLLNLNTENIPKLNSAIAFYQRNNETDPFDFKNCPLDPYPDGRVNVKLPEKSAWAGAFKLA